MENTNLAIKVTEDQKSSLEEIRKARGLRSFSATVRLLIDLETAEMARREKK